MGIKKKNRYSWLHVNINIIDLDAISVCIHIYELRVFWNIEENGPFLEDARNQLPSLEALPLLHTLRHPQHRLNEQLNVK